MKAYFDLNGYGHEKMVGEFELNKSNITKAQQIAEDESEEYAWYNLCIEWSKELNQMRVFLDGPWEC